MTSPFDQAMMTRTELKEYVKVNPDEPVAETVSKLGVSKQHVYNARHDVGVSKPITMSKKKRLKVVRKSTLEDKDARIAELEKQVEMLKINPNQEVRYIPAPEPEIRYIATPDQISAVRSLESKLVDAKAIIAYLEGKLDGASV
jgi:hypothetical protein